MFDIVFLGSGGGPLESNTSGVLVKAAEVPIKQGTFLAVDGGVHLSALLRIIESGSTFFGSSHSSHQLACEIAYRYIPTLAVTHPHLDHLAGYVINTPGRGIYSQGIKQTIIALPGTIETIKSHILNGIVWANISDECIDGVPGEGWLSYQRLDIGTYKEVATKLSLCAYDVSHGSCDSTAFFIRHESGKEIIIFGDVEADSFAKKPRNITVWKAAAEKFMANNLLAIIIECSYDSKPKGSPLFGHLSPPYLYEELRTLASLVNGRLKGLQVIISHIKQDTSDAPEQILASLLALEEKERLGVHFCLATQGGTIQIA